MSYNYDVDVHQIQKNKLFQKFMQQQQQETVQKPQYREVPQQQNMEESSIYQDFANFAKASKNGSPFTTDQNKHSCPQFQPIGTSNNEIKELQNKNKILLQTNSQIQQQLIDLQNNNHRLQIDMEINRNEVVNQKRVIQEQQIEIEQLKRQIQEKRNSSLEKTRQFTIVQTQLIQSNQMVEKLISQLMNQESQLSIIRQTQYAMPKSDLLYQQPTQFIQQQQQQYQPQQLQQPQQHSQPQQQQAQPQQYQQPIGVPQPQSEANQKEQQRQREADTSYERYLAHKRNLK